MTYDKKARSKAASLGWKTRRENQLKLPNPGGIVPGTPRKSSEDTTIAGEIPTSRDSIFANIATWDDPVYLLDHEAYCLMLNCFPLVESLRKRANRTAMLNWGVHGEDKAAIEVVKLALEKAESWTDMIEWLTWADVEGVRFMQIKTKIVGTTVVPTFWMGGYRKANAGGTIRWDGTTLVQGQESSGVETRQATVLPNDQIIIHRPGAGTSPEGDLNLGVAVYRVCRLWEDAMKNTNAHMEKFGTAMRVFHGNMDAVPPTGVNSALENAARKIRNLKNNDDLYLTDEMKLELLEPKGQGFKDMMEYAKYLEGLIDQMFLDNTLSSKVDDAGRTGDTSVHKDAEDDAAFINGTRIAESLNRTLVPWILSRNNIEATADVYIWPLPTQEDEDQDVEADPEQMTEEAADNQDGTPAPEETDEIQGN